MKPRYGINPGTSHFLSVVINVLAILVPSHNGKLIFRISCLLCGMCSMAGWSLIWPIFVIIICYHWSFEKFIQDLSVKIIERINKLLCNKWSICHGGTELALSLSSEFCEIDVFNKIVQLMWKREVCERRLHLQLMSKVNNFLSQSYWTKSLRLVKLQFGMECPLRITGIKVDSTEEGIQARFKFNYLVDFYRYPG